jgi:hypothetical protein
MRKVSLETHTPLKAEARPGPGFLLVIAYLLADLDVCLRLAELIATHRSRNRPFGQQPGAHILAGNEMGQRGLEQSYRPLASTNPANGKEKAR